MNITGILYQPALPTQLQNGDIFWFNVKDKTLRISRWGKLLHFNEMQDTHLPIDIEDETSIKNLLTLAAVLSGCNSPSVIKHEFEDGVEFSCSVEILP